MKTLIVGVPRSGTTSLLRGMKKVSNCDILSEPHNSKTKNHQHNLKDMNIDINNVCVKTLVYHRPRTYIGSSLEYIFNFTKEFNNIILLDRIDYKEHLDSFAHLVYRLHRDESVFRRWKSSDIPNDWKNEFIDELDKTLKEYKKELTELSNRLNIQPTWYEELYGSDRNKSLKIIEKWGIDIDSNALNEYLHPRHKLKVLSKKSVI